jgi:NAD(P)-dependent dehydrogenase (short-subunit alcohol dehydrogenase family)
MEKTMSSEKPNARKTVIVTGGSQGIGAGLVRTFLDCGYSVVANSRNISKSNGFTPSDKLALVDENIAEFATAEKIVEVARSKFGSINALVNNAGIFFSKHFTEYMVVDAIVYLTEADQVTGEVLHVDGGSHVGKW